MTSWLIQTPWHDLQATACILDSHIQRLSVLQGKVCTGLLLCFRVPNFGIIFAGMSKNSDSDTPHIKHYITITIGEILRPDWKAARLTCQRVRQSQACVHHAPGQTFELNLELFKQRVWLPHTLIELTGAPVASRENSANRVSKVWKIRKQDVQRLIDKPGWFARDLPNQST